MHLHLQDPHIFSSPRMVMGLLFSTAFLSCARSASSGIPEQGNASVSAFVSGRPVTFSDLLPGEAAAVGSTLTDRMISQAADKLSLVILAELTAQLGIPEPTAEEIREAGEFLGSHPLKSPDDVDSDSTQTDSNSQYVQNAINSVSRDLVRTWKIDKFIYEKYGGEVVFQQSNPQEPIGAYRAFLKEKEGLGSFRIIDERLRIAFWALYSADNSIVIPKDKVDFSRPWWRRP